MLVAFSSDWHLGAGNSLGSVDPKTGLNSSLAATAKCLKELVETCHARGVQGLVFAGDGFHRRNPGDNERLLFFKVLASFLGKDPDRWVIVMPGTPSHDGRDIHVSSRDSFSLYRMAAQFGGFDKRMFVAQGPSIQKRGDTLYYIATGLGEKDQPDFKEFFARARASREAETTQVLVIHGAVQGVKVGPGDFELPEPLITREMISMGDFDLVVAGHIHGHQVLYDKVVYPGSIDRVDFGERNQKKGFIIWDDKNFDWEFVEVKSAKRFVQVDVNIDAGGIWVPTEKEKAAMKGAVVKLRFVGKKERFSQVDLATFADGFRAAQPLHLTIECERKQETGEPEKVQELHWGAMLSAWLLTRSSLSEKVRSDAYERGVQLLAG